MLSITRNREPGRSAARTVDPSICLCGTRIAPALHQLGSLWCHDCRVDPDQRALVLQDLRRRHRRRGGPWWTRPQGLPT
jgi:hypothetical protein